ncbi:MAG: GNAT family N-acetyltransferase [Treponema sp.]|jgi:GNAT superfamily N-acetyltransferase|nr:GNAT family N-acetyltransferase [Treponema sp.]
MDIKPMTANDLDDAVSLLAASFHDRPFYRYLAPDAAERRIFLIDNFLQRITQGLGVNETDLAIADGKAVGIAVWSPPAASEPDAARHTTEARAMEESLSMYSAGLRERFVSFIKTLTKAREQTIRQPFWSLAPIAVLPDARGKGVASALIKKKLKEIDKRSLPCFLGTQDAINVTIYEKFGFQKMREDPISSDIIHYTMLRSGGG